MLLNKINVLDKGFVAMIDSTCEGKMLQDLQDTYFKTKINMRLLSLCSATFIIKCPLFVQLNMSQYGFDIVSTPSDDIEAYIPDVAAVSGDTVDDRQRMVNYIESTTEALLLNQKGMPMDGADALTAQMLTPISTYNEIIVKGDLRQWINYLNQKNLPMQVESFRQELESLLLAGWKNLPALKKMLK